MLMGGVQQCAGDWGTVGKAVSEAEPQPGATRNDPADVKKVAAPASGTRSRADRYRF